MRIHRALWGSVLVVVASASVLGAVGRLGVPSVAGVAAAFAGIGLLFGLAWGVDGRRGWLAARCGPWFAVGGLLLLGLPTVLGAWALLVLPLLAGSAPPLVRHAVRDLAGRRPDRRSGRDLERRWHRTSDELARAGTSPGAALRLVQERALLLDELERRDPEEFAARLVRAGWRAADSGADL